MSAALNIAQRLASFGFKVLPVSKDKVPVLKDWSRIASDDPPSPRESAMIKRYDPACCKYLGSYPDCEEADDGDYVLYTDHQEAIRQARAEALEEARCAYEAHHHVAKSFLNPGAYPPDDSCAYCGLDLRNPVHLRHGEVKELRIRALKERQPEGER